MRGRKIAEGKTFGERGMPSYGAGIILGAGLLTVTFQEATVGLVLLIVGVLVMGAAANALYKRVTAAGAAAGPWESSTSGAAAERCGSGPAGAWLATFGLGVYSVGASIGYTSLATTALNAMLDASLRLGHAQAPLMLGLWALAVTYIALRGPGRVGVPVKLASAWLPLMIVAVLVPVARAEALIVAFIAGVLALRHGSPQAETSSTSDKIRSAVQALRLQLVLMAVLVIAAALSLLANRHGLVAPRLLPQHMSLTQVLRAVGVVLFAMVGCGFANLGRHPAMRDAATRRRLINRSMALVVSITVVWLCLTALELPTAALTELDTTRSFTTVGLARLIEPGTILGSAALVVASLALLLAVTGACSGFLEGFTAEISHARAGHAPSGKILEWSVLILLVIVGFGSWAAQQIGLSTSDVLASAGTAGGGVVLFVLPVLCERRTNQKRRMARVAVGASILVAIAACYQAITATSNVYFLILNVALSAAGIPLTTAAAFALARSHRARARILRTISPASDRMPGSTDAAA